MSVDLAALAKLAAEATPGPWEYEPGDPDDPAGCSWPGVYVPAERGPRCMSFGVTTYNAEADAAYIAAADPQTILWMIERIFELERRAGIR